MSKLFKGAPSDEEAKIRAEKHHHHTDDPFKDVDAALLNSADALRYIDIAGILFPFEVDTSQDSNDVKAASIGIPLRGRVIYWDEDNIKHDFYLTEKALSDEQKSMGAERREEFTIGSNAIVFVTLEPYFRLPKYIAARFNLTIRDVYRGLLLGTGPLVDPGYTGRLSLPLHNLTNNAYHYRAGEVMVWMEFTKLSKFIDRQDGLEVGGFNKLKDGRKSLPDYLYHAHGGGSIRSSIPIEIKEAKRNSQAAADLVRRVAVAGIVALALSLFGVGISISSLLLSTEKMISDLRQDLQQRDMRIAAIESKLQTLQENKKSGKGK